MTNFLVDTGSIISIINKGTWDKINKNKPHLSLEKSLKRAFTANHQQIKTLGVGFLRAKTGTEEFIQKFVCQLSVLTAICTAVSCPSASPRQHL
jgi:hypothetical protein